MVSYFNFNYGAKTYICLMVAAASLVLTACQLPAHQFEVTLPSYVEPVQLPQGAEQLPLRVGIYYDSKPETHIFVIPRGEVYETVTPLGEFSNRQFNSIFRAMFEHRDWVFDHPPYPVIDSGSGPLNSEAEFVALPANQPHIVIEWRIESFDHRLRSGPTNIEYRFKLYLPDGRTLAIWYISAADTRRASWSEHSIEVMGAATEAVVRDVSVQFMKKFYDSPVVDKWLAEINSKSIARKMSKATEAEITPVTSSLEGVHISADLYWQAGLTRIAAKDTQTPIEIMCTKSAGLSPVLMINLKIKNNRSEPVVFEPSDIRFHTNRQVTLTPDSPGDVGRKIFNEVDSINNRITAGKVMREAGVFSAGMLTMLGLTIATLNPEVGRIGADMVTEGFDSQSRSNKAQIKLRLKTKTIDQFVNRQLENLTIAPNQSASGLIYFFAPGGDGVLANPKLRVGILDPAQRQVYETVLDMTTGTSTSDQLLIPGLALPEIVVEKTIELTTADTDITGVYVSEITGGSPGGFGNRTLVLAFEQKGENITATNCTSHEKIHATRGGDTITFLWADREGMYPEVTGEWKVNADGSLLEGTWDAGNDVGKWESRGKWKLIKLDQAKSTEDAATIVTGNTAASTINITDQSTPASWRNLLSGNTATGKTEKGSTWHVYHATDGTMLGRSTTRNNSESQDSGTWEITEEGKFCGRWRKWRGGSRDCFTMGRNGDGRFRDKAINKSYEYIYTIREGDPEGLARGSAAVNKQLPPGFKFTGRYLSENSGKKGKTLSDMTGEEVILVQTGGEISGTFLGSGKIWGRIEGDTIQYDYFAPNGNTGIGEWEVSADGSELRGSWIPSTRNYSGTWNLYRAKSVSAATTIKATSSLIQEDGSEGFGKGSTISEPVNFTGDFSGTYKSEIIYTEISKNVTKLSFFGNHPEILVKIEQAESKIKGILVGGRTGEIKGTVDGNKIEFDFTVQPPGGSLKEGNGVWVLDDASGVVSGKWEIDYGAYHSAGKWNLIKIE
jgi:predicted secreted protein